MKKYKIVPVLLMLLILVIPRHSLANPTGKANTANPLYRSTSDLSSESLHLTDEEMLAQLSTLVYGFGDSSASSVEPVYFENVFTHEESDNTVTLDQSENTTVFANNENATISANQTSQMSYEDLVELPDSDKTHQQADYENTSGSVYETELVDFTNVVMQEMYISPAGLANQSLKMGFVNPVELDHIQYSNVQEEYHRNQSDYANQTSLMSSVDSDTLDPTGENIVYNDNETPSGSMPQHSQIDSADPVTQASSADTANHVSPENINYSELLKDERFIAAFYTFLSNLPEDIANTVGEVGSVTPVTLVNSENTNIPAESVNQAKQVGSSNPDVQIDAENHHVKVNNVINVTQLGSVNQFVQEGSVNLSTQFDSANSVKELSSVTPVVEVSSVNRVAHIGSATPVVQVVSLNPVAQLVSVNPVEELGPLNPEKDVNSLNQVKEVVAPNQVSQKGSQSFVVWEYLVNPDEELNFLSPSPTINGIMKGIDILMDVFTWINNNIKSNKFDETIQKLQNMIYSLPNNLGIDKAQIFLGLSKALDRIIIARVMLEDAATKLKLNCKDLIQMYEDFDGSMELIQYTAKEFIDDGKLVMEQLNEAKVIFVEISDILSHTFESLQTLDITLVEKGNEIERLKDQLIFIKQNIHALSDTLVNKKINYLNHVSYIKSYKKKLMMINIMSNLKKKVSTYGNKINKNVHLRNVILRVQSSFSDFSNNIVQTKTHFDKEISLFNSIRMHLNQAIAEQENSISIADINLGIKKIMSKLNYLLRA